MSGIAAIFNRDGAPADRAEIERILSALAHRGPDGRGIWCEGPVALGHAALHTTPESSQEHQPLYDETGGLCLILDGRVDNRAELAAALRENHSGPHDDTDAAMVLAAYRCWSEAAPARIVGDFAFVIWDGDRRRLFCARDCVGMKPFYYCCDGRGFICGSEIGALLAVPRVPREPNEAVVADYLTDRHRSRTQTLFKHLMRLEAGHCLIVDERGITTRRYYDLAPGRELRYARDDQYAEHFFAIFKEAVRVRLRSSGAVGCYLSGGLDSSSIIGMAQTLYRDGTMPRARFETYSMLLPPPADEREFINEVVRRWGLSSNTPAPCVPDQSFLIDQVRRFHALPETPNAIVMSPLRQLAQAQGVRVMLDGIGGDDWLQGTRSYCADLIAGLRLAALAKRLRVQVNQARIYGVPFSPWRELLGNGIKPLLPSALSAALSRARGREPSVPWIDAGLMRRSGSLEPSLPSQSGPPGGSFAWRELHEVFVDPFAALVHESEDRTAAWCGFEARSPFFDRRLIEFCCALPEDQRRTVVTKVVLRNAMRGLLPETVRTRLTKAEFSAPFFNALRAPGIPELFAT
ncbi:MAG TPA: asparagine synthase-related protein, partial [Candidatus Binataceae bacterium]|nr:asparagine synthase-related protein [Candidatus Binataceae bacterium]